MRWRAQRWVVDFPTMVSSEQSTQPLDILSISTSGARMRGAHDFNEGDTIRISCLSGQISATVVWVKDSECGIKFSCPLGLKQLSTIRKPGVNGSVAWSFNERVSNVHRFREL